MLQVAVSTGALAKLSGVFVQLAAIPFAVRQMGLEAFGQYAFAIALFSWVFLLDAVWGQALVRKTVAAINRSDASAVTSLVFTAFAATAAFVSGGAALLVVIGGAWILLGGQTGIEGGITLFVASGCIACVRMLLAVVARARAAFQQIHVENLLALAANCVAITAVFVCVRIWPTPLALLLAVFVPPVLAQLVSGLILYRSNPLLHGRLVFDKTMARSLLSEGRWLSLGQVGVIMERQVPIIVFTLLAMSQMGGQYAVAMQLMTMSASVLIIMTTPLMPAIAEAMHSGDTEWWVSRVRSIDRVVICAGVAGSIGAILIGQELLSALFGVSDLFSRSALGALAVWVAAMLSALCYYSVLMAAGRAEQIGKRLFAYGLSFLVLGAPAFLSTGFVGVFVVGALLTLLCTRGPWARETRRLAVAAERGTDVRFAVETESVA